MYGVLPLLTTFSEYFGNTRNFFQNKVKRVFIFLQKYLSTVTVLILKHCSKLNFPSEYILSLYLKNLFFKNLNNVKTHFFFSSHDRRRAFSMLHVFVCRSSVQLFSNGISSETTEPIKKFKRNFTGMVLG